MLAKTANINVKKVSRCLYSGTGDFSHDRYETEKNQVTSFETRVQWNFK
jgi:hypothetical protein